MKKNLKYWFLFSILLMVANLAAAQLSPGDLTNAHKHLEGLSNCTKCHVLGEQETSSRCLECHKEIKNLINQKKGFHASLEVKGKKCAECHGEHFGRNFQIIHFNNKTFDHKLTGYNLEGKHKKIECLDCHKTEFINNKISQKKEGSYLGLETECLSCHKDYHQNTLSKNCTSCHNQNAFKPALGFNHSKTDFVLVGKHQTVECAKCHKIEQRNGEKFQQFSDLEFTSCTSCHNDVHQNKFGNDCRKCHTEFSFHKVKSLSSFNHEKTDFQLRGKHNFVDCKKCHTGSYTRPVQHKLCVNCHHDYHENQFLKNDVLTDCIECHSVSGFTPSAFGIEKHKRSKFPLEGAHLATPCFTCHKKDKKWTFKVGNRCVDCHENIHENYMNEKYMPEIDCKTCHSTSIWNEVTFDHNTTDFALFGKHKQLTCRKCHFKQNPKNELQQQFKWENQSCTNCHNNVHFEQFKENGESKCESCHTNSNWKPEQFDHNNARFKLDGKHQDLACAKCHKPADDLLKNYVVYKFKDISCASCH